MLKQYISAVIFTLIALIMTQANALEFFEDWECCCNPCEQCLRPSVEIKTGYFFFEDSKMRKIYDQQGWDVQLSGSYPIWNNWLQVYGSVEYLQKKGRSRGGHQRTSIWELPVSLGLKPTFEICPGIQYYFTVGPRYFYVRQTNHSHYVDKHVHKSGVGGFVNTGVNYFFCENLFVDVFGEYSFAKLHFHAHKENVEGRDIEIGGWTFGAGLGYTF